MCDVGGGYGGVDGGMRGNLWGVEGVYDYYHYYYYCERGKIGRKRNYKWEETMKEKSCDYYSQIIVEDAKPTRESSR